MVAHAPVDAEVSASVSRPPHGLRRLAATLALVGLVLGLAAALPGGLLVGPVGAASSSAGRVTGSIAGPSLVGTGLNISLVVNGTGGPAFNSTGALVGTLTYNATLINGNSTGSSLSPSTGPLTNGTANVTFTAGNLTETLTVNVEINSTYGNESNYTNVTHNVRIVRPYTLTGTLLAGSVEVRSLVLTVTLDGRVVGSFAVSAIAPNSTYAFTFHYVPTTALATGWHTFAISLAQQHGLVTFPGGLEEYSTAFYVNSPPPNYTVDVLVGVAAFVLAVFIWGAAVGARRRPR